MNKAHDQLLKEARDRMAACVDAEDGNRSAAVEDLRFLKGEQWPAGAEAQRKLEGRPCMTFNQLPAIVQQVTNDQRQNTPSIKVHPVDDDADVETADVIQGLIRHIEYDSNADAAYDTAVNAAATHGFGVWRLLTEYEAPDSFDQVIRFSRVRNALSVYIDPYAQCPVASDMRYCFITDVVPRDVFKREYPKATATDGLSWEGVGDAYKAGWLRDDGVVVAEYYWIDLKPDTLVLLQDGTTAWKSDLGPDAAVVSAKTRSSMRRTVKWAKMTGLDVLEEADIPGHWIPVFPVYGQELDIEGKVHRWGIVRNAKDPARMYNFWMPLRTDTPIATPEGWSTIGTLSEGDTVFSDAGTPTKVIGKSPVYINRDCFRVTFGDGTWIDADAQHPWVVEERSKRTSAGFTWTQKKLRTDEIDPARHSIKLAGPLQQPDAALPLDPYFLGVWLGDGASAEPRITASDEDAEDIRALLIARGLDVGAAVKYGDKAPVITVHGVRATMRGLGLLGNKHIPAQYMRASEAQRLELLRGLMDTDGHVTAKTGQCAFTQMRQELADQVRELLVSLGVRVGMLRRPARVSMMANGHSIEGSGCAVLSFAPPEGVSVFAMPRKAAQQMRQRPRTPRRTGYHRIASVERIESVPVQCIAIDAPSHLFLAGPSMVPTHNTAATEEVAMRPKTPYVGAEGQFEGYEQDWANANKSSRAYIEYKPVTVSGQLAPPPQRQPMADVPVGVLQMAMHAKDNIKSTTGMYDASLGAQGNETSGRAILARQKEGDTANFHFTDNLNRAIRHCGRVLVDMIPRIYDAERVIRIRGEDESISSAKVNGMEPDPETGVDRVINDLTVGKYDVTIAAGPSYTTQRQEAAEAMTQFAQSWPKLMDVAGDKVVASMDWPGAEEIAERIKKTLPPGMADQDDGDQPPQIPPEAQQQMQQMDQAIQQMTQELEAAQSGLEKARIDAASRERVAEINAAGRLDVEELKSMVQMLVQRLQPPPELAALAMQSGVPPNAQPPDPQPQQPPEQNPPSAGFSVSGADESRAMANPAAMEFAPGAGGLPDDPQLTGQEIAQ